MLNKLTMRLLALLVFAAICIAVLSGCESPATEPPAPEQNFERVLGGKFDWVKVWRDPLTGCHWITYVEGGLQPRLYSDGVQVCE